MSVYEFKPERYSSHTLLLNALPERGEGRRVLDLGAGPGFLAAELARRGYDVTAVERTRGHADVFWIEGDLDGGLPALDGVFDYILCADILEHLREPEAALTQLLGVLALGGRVVASLPNSGNIYFRLVVLGGRFPREDRGLFDRTHLHFYTWDGWNELFAFCGMDFETVACTGIPVGLRFPGARSTQAALLAERVAFEFAKLWRTLFAYQFVVTAVRK